MAVYRFKFLKDYALEEKPQIKLVLKTMVQFWISSVQSLIKINSFDYNLMSNAAVRRKLSINR